MKVEQMDAKLDRKGQTDDLLHSSSAVAMHRPRLWSPLLSAVLVGVIVAVTLVAYSPVMFDWFAGDDFVHLTWLKDAVKQPELIWRNFHSSWLDGTTTKFYRPLISIFMVSDYMIWGPNGFGFHLTNVIFHLIATVVMFFLAKELLFSARLHEQARLARTEGEAAASSIEAGSRLDWMYCFAASAIFGLYPLHTEAVSWITGRVDAVVSAFYICSIWSYIKWRQNPAQGSAKKGLSGAAWFAACMINFCLGLLSKEMAVTLPVLFLVWEVVLGPSSLGSKVKSAVEAKTTNPLWATAVNAIKYTAIFWAVLVGYFALRRYALGTFVGGYDDSLFFVADVKHFILSWIHALRMFLIPLNKNLIGAHHILTRGWEIHMVLIGAICAVNLLIDRSLRRLFFFNFLFLGLALAPVYKIFAISDDLQGSRLAHVATLALSLLLAICFITPLRALAARGKDGTAGDAEAKRPSLIRSIASDSRTRGVLLTTFTLLLATVLWTNNQTWARAGKESNSIRKGLSDLYTNQVKGDPQVLLIGLPDQMDGAYISRNALWGMTKSPQLHRDIWNCLMLNQYEQILPFGYLKESLFDSRDKVRVFQWSSAQGKFLPLPVGDVEPSTIKREWHGSELKQIVKEESFATWDKDGNLEVKGDAGRFGKPEMVIDLGSRSCFHLDFIGINVEDLGSSPDLLKIEGADLLYTNDVRPNFNLPERTHADFQPNQKTQTLILPLRGLPEWSFGAMSHQLKLRLPRSARLKITGISILPPDTVIPKMTFPNSGFFGTKGFLHLSQKDKQVPLSIDVSGIPGASGAVLEITRPNLYFELQNTILESKVKMRDMPFSKEGELILRRDQVPALGVYEARPWAVDKNGKKIGICGDHIVISVDS